MTTQPEPRCANCRFARRQAGKLWCWRYPPQVVWITGGLINRSAAVVPEVQTADVCGEHQPADAGE